MSSYSHLRYAEYLLLRISDPASARLWFARLANEITTAEHKREDYSLNLALTSSGLSKLGLDRDALSSFPRTFVEGMTTEPRPRILGDTKDSSPERWRWGGPRNPVDILLIIFAADENGLAVRLKQRRDEFGQTGGIVELQSLEGHYLPGGREHFGFADGISQPYFEDSGSLVGSGRFGRTDPSNIVNAGEFILGYINSYGTLADSPRVHPSSDPNNLLSDDGTGMRDLGRNGTYLVFRQMAQHVAQFWRCLDVLTRQPDGSSDPIKREALGAKFVGRWPSGAPLVLSPENDNATLARANNFRYSEDPHGFACPIGAHIRRANPRDSFGRDRKTRDAALRSVNRHRILRRGRSYGPPINDPLIDDGLERGLHFICLNSDIERQFEFIQHTWINNPVFDCLDGEVDPLVGMNPLNPDNDQDDRLMTLQKDPLRSRIHNLQRFITVKGGAYFFVPGICALKYLAKIGS